MKPEDFLGGGDFTNVSADEFTKGGFSVVTPETDAPAAPEAQPQSFMGGLGSAIKNMYGSYADASRSVVGSLAGVGEGALKGAASTVATVPTAIGNVISSATQASNDKQFQLTRDQLSKKNDELLAKMHALPSGSPERQRVADEIKINMKTYSDLSTSEAGVTADVSNVADSFGKKPDFVKPQGTAQKVGFGAEHIAEFMVPGAAIAKGETAVKTVLGSTSIAPGFKAAARILAGAGMEGLSSGAITSAQGGDLGDAGNAAFWGSILSVPFKAVGVLREPVGKIIEQSAEKSASQALGATTKGNKALSDKVVPGLLDKRVRFLTRAGLEDTASQSASDVGEQIGQAWDNVPPDTKVVLTPMMQRMEAAKELLVVKGTSKVPEAAQPQYSALQNLQKEILDLTGQGPQLEKASGIISKNIDEIVSVLPKDAPAAIVTARDTMVQSLTKDGLNETADLIKNMDLSGLNNVDDFKKALTGTIFANSHASAESVRSFRGILDKVIAKNAKGVFAMTGDESAKLASQKEGANAMRNALNEEFPDIARLNAEFNFWKNVEKVVGDTVARTKSQATPLGEVAAEGAGVVAGAVKGGGALTMVLGATGLRLLQKAITSPAFRMTSAIAKHDLANALLSSNTQAALNIINRILNGSISSESAPQ